MLLRAKAVEFIRAGEDEIIVRFLGENQEDVLMTMEPRFIKEGMGYLLKFGSTLIIRGDDFPPFDDRSEFDHYFNEL